MPPRHKKPGLLGMGFPRACVLPKTSAAKGFGQTAVTFGCLAAQRVPGSAAFGRGAPHARREWVWLRVYRRN